MTISSRCSLLQQFCIKQPRVLSALIAVFLPLSNSPLLYADGPGVPNRVYPEEFVLTVISQLNSTNGAPRSHAIVSMHKGYLIVVFSSDDGGSDGGFSFYDISDPFEPELVFQKDDDETQEIREAHGYDFSSSYPGDYVALQAAYEIVVPKDGLRDLVDNAVPSSFSSTFTTAPPQLPLSCQITHLAPAETGANAIFHVRGIGGTGDFSYSWDFTDRGEGFRNTTSLLGRRRTGHGRVHWSANFDEIQDFENDIRNAFGGDGFHSDADSRATNRWAIPKPD